MKRPWSLGIASSIAAVGAIGMKSMNALTRPETVDTGLTAREASEIALARTGAVQVVALEQRSGPVYIVVVEHKTGTQEAVRINGAGGENTERDSTSGHTSVESDDLFDQNDND